MTSSSLSCSNKKKSVKEEDDEKKESSNEMSYRSNHSFGMKNNFKGWGYPSSETDG